MTHITKVTKGCTACPTAKRRIETVGKIYCEVSLQDIGTLGAVVGWPVAELPALNNRRLKVVPSHSNRQSRAHSEVRNADK